MPSRFIEKKEQERDSVFSHQWFVSGNNPKIYVEKVDIICRQWYNEANYRLNGYCRQCVNCQNNVCLFALDVPPYRDERNPCLCPSYFKRLNEKELETLTYQFFDHLKAKPVFTVDLPEDLDLIL